MKRKRFSEEQIAFALKGNAALFELTIQPLSAVQSDADGEREPALDAHVAKAETFMLKVVVIMHATARLLAWLDQATLVLAETIDGTGFQTGQQGDPA